LEGLEPRQRDGDLIFSGSDELDVVVALGARRRLIGIFRPYVHRDDLRPREDGPGAIRHRTDKRCLRCQLGGGSRHKQQIGENAKAERGDRGHPSCPPARPIDWVRHGTIPPKWATSPHATYLARDITCRRLYPVVSTVPEPGEQT